jgi:hypothetical protein
MRWPFRGSTIADYLALFRACLELPPDEVDAVETEVRAHLEDAADAIGGQRKEAELHATLALGSPRDLAARIGSVRRHGRPSMVLVIDPPVQYLKYEVPGDPVRTFRRSVGFVLAVFPFLLTVYWAGVILGQKQGTIYLVAWAVALIVGLAGRWVMPRLTMTEALHVSLGYALLAIAVAGLTGLLYLAHLVQGDAILWAGSLGTAVVLAAVTIYRLRNPNSSLVIGLRPFDGRRKAEEQPEP